MSPQPHKITKGDLTILVLAALTFALSALPIVGRCSLDCGNTNLWSVAETWNVGLVYFLSIVALLSVMFVPFVRDRLDISEEQRPLATVIASAGPAVVALGGLPSIGSQSWLYWVFLAAALAMPIVAFKAKTSPALQSEVGGPRRMAASSSRSGLARVQVAPAPDFQPYWFSVPEHREAFDSSSGEVSFVLDPDDWYLAVRDLGGAYVVRRDDDREAILRDIRFLIRPVE